MSGSLKLIQIFLGRPLHRKVASPYERQPTPRITGLSMLTGLEHKVRECFTEN